MLGISPGGLDAAKIGSKCDAAAYAPFFQKKSRSALRDLSCLGTLIKDVRDVAAAVLCSEGPGE
jgi:hypothetical protein